MTKMTRLLRLVAIPACAILLAACGGKSQPPAEPPIGTPAADEPAPDQPTAGDPTPNGPPAGEPVAEEPLAGEPDAPADEPPTAALEDWIVWTPSGDGWTSRWFAGTADGFELVAERRGPILSDGMRLWRIERRDVKVDVFPCRCLEDEEEHEDDEPQDCSASETLVIPGIVAVDLDGGSAQPIHVGDGESQYGDEIEASVGLQGGVGPRLAYAWTLGGYFCGASGLYEGGAGVYDLARGEGDHELIRRLAAALPEEVVAGALAEIHEALVDCDGDEVTLEDAREQMGVAAMHLGLDTDGAPLVRWTFSAEVSRVCSADYQVSSTTASGLLPELVAAGLGDPLPQGIGRALAPFGEAHTVGWSRLALAGEARDAALARFKAAPEPAWAPSSMSSTPTAARLERRSSKAQELVQRGRKATAAGQYDEAIAHFDGAIRLDEALAPARSGLGFALLRKGDLDGAKDAFEAALERDETPVFRAQVLYNLGQVAERQGDVAAARDAYTRSLALRDNDGVKKALERVK